MEYTYNSKIIPLKSSVVFGTGAKQSRRMMKTKAESLPEICFLYSRPIAWRSHDVWETRKDQGRPGSTMSCFHCASKETSPFKKPAMP
jgi:hypothetical protein